MNIYNTPGALLTLDVLALGNAGYFAVNNTFVARLDLSSVTGVGDILAGTAFFNESYADGGSTNFDQFAVWSVALQPETPANAPTPIPREPPVAATPVPANASPTPDSGAPATPPEDAVDIQTASPATALTSLEDVRASESASRASALLQPVNGQDIHGYGVATRVARSIEISILITNAETGSLVALLPGICGQLSDDPQSLEPVGALNGQGMVVTTLPIRLTDMLNFGAYSLAVYTPADTAYANPLACGQLIAD